MPHPSHRALDLLCHYAEYHRDRRNIQTHLVGVPMIVFAASLLLARPGVEVAGWTVTPAWLIFGLAAVWYVTRGALGIGLATTAGVGILVGLAHQVPASGTAAWLAWGLVLFVLGWAIQFLGHYYEGRRPASAEDPVGLLVGPMFVTLELCALAGGCRRLMDEIEARVGPTHLRDLAHPAA
jgi:uncharacterized membrane protein YGL010W